MKILRFHNVEIDLQSRSILRDGLALQPHPRSFDLLVYLIERRGRIIAKHELLRQLWGDARVAEDDLLQCVAELRKALGDDARQPRFIKAISKSGYQWVAEVEPAKPLPAPPPVSEAPAEPAIPQPPLPCPTPGHRGVPIWAIAAAIAVLAGILLVWLFRAHARKSLPPAGSAQAVLIPYFDNQSRTLELDRSVGGPLAPTDAPSSRWNPET